jgi:hypothetical protein
MLDSRIESPPGYWQSVAPKYHKRYEQFRPIPQLLWSRLKDAGDKNFSDTFRLEQLIEAIDSDQEEELAITLNDEAYKASLVKGIFIVFSHAYLATLLDQIEPAVAGRGLSRRISLDEKFDCQVSLVSDNGYDVTPNVSQVLSSLPEIGPCSTDEVATMAKHFVVDDFLEGIQQDSLPLRRWTRQIGENRLPLVSNGSRLTASQPTRFKGLNVEYLYEEGVKLAERTLVINPI